MVYAVEASPKTFVGGRCFESPGIVLECMFQCHAVVVVNGVRYAILPLLQNEWKAKELCPLLIERMTSVAESLWRQSPETPRGTRYNGSW